MSLSICLIDDSKVVRSVVRRLLKSLIKDRELNFSEANSGTAGLELLRNNPFDLAFLDLTMPDMTGYEVLEALQSENVPGKIFVLTADIQPESEKKVRGLGATGYLTKPLKDVDLRAALKENGIL